MAVPKHKTSKARRNSRHSANSVAVAPTLVEGPHCHEMKKPHTVCKKCGTYKGETVIAKKDETK
ncbi:MAG: 50S ribosomal protein L32 [Clostridia bacterium]|nr:50S ribosomal protein L32 [Clostridia bacterium]